MGTRIVYIIGAGRSGTTLLDIILGNAADIFSAGELNRFTKRNGVPHEARDENVSYFWLDIVKQLKAEKYNEPRLYYKFAKEFEYHSSLHRYTLRHNKAKFKLYADYQRALFNAITVKVEKDFGKNTIVDSSKYPLRALLLARIFQKDISFVYIKRDPVIVVESFQKKDVEQPPKNRLAANTYLLVVNGLAVWVLKKLRKTNKVSEITYDNLLTAPLAELERIEKDINLDLSVPKKLIGQKSLLTVGYLFDGNRLRLNDKIALKDELAPVDKKSYTSKIFGLLHKMVWYQN